MSVGCAQSCLADSGAFRVLRFWNLKEPRPSEVADEQSRPAWSGPLRSQLRRRRYSGSSWTSADAFLFYRMKTKTARYLSQVATLGLANYKLQSDRRLGIRREELLAYIDRHKRRASPEPEFNRYACTTWNGGASSSTRLVFRFLMRLFKANDEGKFVNVRKRPMDEDGFVRIFRAEIQTATRLKSTAVGTALRRMEELEIITRKHERNEANGHRRAWFRLNPDAIYKLLNLLPGFHVAREEVRKRSVAVDREKEPVTTEIVEVVQDRPDAKKKAPQNSSFSSPGPATEVRQVCYIPGSGVAGVAGQSGEPGAEVVEMAGPAAPVTSVRNKKNAPAAPEEVFQPGEGNRAASKLNPQAQIKVQRMDAAARKAGMQLAPIGLAGGAPFLIRAGRQTIYPRRSSVERGFMFIPPGSQNSHAAARAYAST